MFKKKFKNTPQTFSKKLNKKIKSKKLIAKVRQDLVNNLNETICSKMRHHQFSYHRNIMNILRWFCCLRFIQRQKEKAVINEKIIEKNISWLRNYHWRQQNDQIECDNVSVILIFCFLIKFCY